MLYRVVYQSELGDAAVRRVWLRAGGDECQSGCDGEPDALGVRADRRQYRQQHERLPVRGDERLPDGRGHGSDAAGAPVL